MPEPELPEFMRSLRALAVPSAPGAEHDRVLKPLVAARAAAHKARSTDAQVAAFDATRLEREWREAIGALAAARFGSSAPDRRALEAELDQLAAPLWAALKSLQRAAVAARANGVTATVTPDERRAAWDSWLSAVQRTVDAADDWWRDAGSVLRAADGARRPVWRRLLGRKG